LASSQKCGELPPKALAQMPRAIMAHYNDDLFERAACNL
jgi:hypothetical protein